MKILHIITRLDRGGSADIALSTAKEMERRGHEVYLVSGKTREIDRQRVHAFWPEGKILYIEEFVRDITPPLDFVAFRKLYALIRQLKPDIVHTHSSKGGFLGRWAAWLARAPHIIHMPHGHVFYGYFGKSLSNLIRFVEKVSTYVTGRIITLTELESAEYEMLKVSERSKLVTIYNGIDLGRYQRKDISSLPEGVPPKTGPVILSVARLDPVKGHRYLIEAMLFIRNYFPTAQLLIVGEGSQRVNFERECHVLRVTDSVTLLGERNDIPDLLSIADVFVLPSLNEGLGIVLLEAQAMGVPIVATRVGGIPEAVRDGETGILVPPRNSPAIAQAVISLLARPDKRKQLGEAGRKWVTGEVEGKPRFGIDRMYDRIEQLYRETMQQ